ncbi:MAG: hypothetical protein CVU09_11385 [Bacteroidetes bacterium HGW-Bacteroidetes-4]|jgi:PAS domain S-box-containing protein|nr:MAG: hypothetical protein CVU09_11385 [Bacteroidetes bacterium HGW-Bacteroidetes-4]
MNKMLFISEAFNPMVYKRAIKVAFIVGLILNLINQWGSIVSGFQGFHFVQFFLTFLVPYLVSTYSSVLSKFNFVSGEVASFDAHITCHHCGESTVSVQKGDLVPYCPKCVTKTRWQLIKILPPETFLDDDKVKSNALFAQFNPAPVIRVDQKGHILKANPTAQMLFHIEGKGETIGDVITELKTLNSKLFISSNRVETYQIQIGEDFYQLDLRALTDLGVYHIYASKITSLIAEKNKRQLFQNAIEQSTNSIMVTNTIGDIVFVNPAFEKHSGYSFDEIKGANPRILKSGHQGNEVYKEMWDTIKTGDSWKGLFQNKKKDGTLYWEKVHITPIKDHTAVITNYLAVKEDVTEELLLKDQLKSFALFAQHNPDPVLRIGTDLKIKEANLAANKLFNAESLIDVISTGLIPELEPIDFPELITNGLQNQVVIQVGDQFLQLVLKGVKELQLCHVYSSNITAQRIAEQKIESMALFARLNPAPVFRFDNEFRVIEGNPAALQTFNGLLKGVDVREIVPALSDLPVQQFITENRIQELEVKVNERIYSFILLGVNQSNICLVYSSDITERVEQEQKIRLQAEKIQSSIKYASNIQAAVLPNLNYVNEILPENMILNLPRDVVSGDFYWIKKVDGSIVIAIADCTGHGVPGAFMSMLGVAFLNEIVKPGNLVANEILNKLRDYVINTLSNSEGSRADGMDMALCIIQPNNKTIQYAGANNPFVLINKEGIQIIKADKMPIGTYVKQDKPFTLHEMPYQTGDVVYLFSDGYQDQLGGSNLLKFGSKNFRELLFNIHKEDFSSQKQLLETTLEKWVDSYHRIDDVLVMGFALS